MPKRKTCFIAEAGSCGDASLSKMEELITVAASVGASAVKFQWTSSSRKMAKRRHATKTYAAHYKKFLQWPAEWHEQLALIAKQRGVDYLCTVYLPEDVEVVAPHVSQFKISSFECQDAELRDTIATFTKPMIVSTGMTTIADLDFAFGYTADELKLLHCVSAYPAPYSSLNLKVLRRSYLAPEKSDHKREALTFSGFSDHTAPNYVTSGALAVCAGAEILEAHFRLHDTEPENPDYAHSMTPDQLQSYILNVEVAELAMGTSEKAPANEEEEMSKFRVLA
jgi:N,N'-diacetyllegionaminate synthase